MTADSLMAVARRLLFVRETGGANRGLWVELFLRHTGNVASESWCASFVCYVLSIVYRGQSPLVRTASTDTLLVDCRRKGYLVTTPRVGDLVFSMRAGSTTDAHHVGFVTSVDPLGAVAGNTSPSGQSDNGDGVHEHGISSANKLYARLPEAREVV